MEEVEVGTVLQHMLSDHARYQQVKQARFSNPDIQYLQRKTGLDHKIVARTIRIFGETVVLEALRRSRHGCEPGVFVGICRSVEAAGGEPHGDAAGPLATGPHSPPASLSGEA